MRNGINQQCIVDRGCASAYRRIAISVSAKFQMTDKFRIEVTPFKIGIACPTALRVARRHQRHPKFLASSESPVAIPISVRARFNRGNRNSGKCQGPGAHRRDRAANVTPHLPSFLHCGRAAPVVTKPELGVQSRTQTVSHATADRATA